MRTILLLLLAACAGTQARPQPAGSRGMRASEHAAAARQHDELATQQGHWPETHPEANGRIDQPIGLPWRASWDSEADHQRLAAIHRSAAAELHAAYDEACAGRALADISVSPLARWGTGGAPTSDGVVIALDAKAGSPAKLLADIRCHRAWMMLAPSNMDTCPLDLAGIHVDAAGDASGITVTITVRDPALVPELQRRAAHDVETGAAHSMR